MSKETTRAVDRLAAAGALVLAIATLAQPAGAQEEEVRGRRLALKLCATCHMGEGQGEKRAGNEVPGFAAIANRPDQTIEGVVRWLESIPPMMPNHHLTQSEMFDLATFILSLRKPAAEGGS